jgi:hypothetical protein
MTPPSVVTDAEGVVEEEQARAKKETKSRARMQAARTAIVVPLDGSEKTLRTIQSDMRRDVPHRAVARHTAAAGILRSCRVPL